MQQASYRRTKALPRLEQAFKTLGHAGRELLALTGITTGLLSIVALTAMLLP